MLGFNSLDFIMRAESGEIETEEEYAEGMQAMIDTGLVWQLQGSWQRAAVNAIESGLCHRR